MRKFTSFLAVTISLLTSSFSSFAQMAASSCTPGFRDSTLACTDGMYVRIIAIASAPVSLNDVTPCNGSGYEDCTELPGGSCSLNAGTTYSATIKTGYSEMSCQVWIDFNNDGIFQPGESVGGIATFGWGTGTAATSLVIPSTVAPGTFRMRIVGDWYVAAGGIQYVASTSTVSIPPCPTPAIYYGDARDYSVTILHPLNTPGLKNAGNISIYPNPTTTSLTISAPDRITSVAISDLLGQQVYSHQCNAPQVQIDVAGLPAGVYFVKVNETEVQKFVKL